mmetsp:Transcript_90054/g.143337  ORF Transcript_90054/g.143337 Transcript_90054/m.143337 type:complete len:208 (+) Transcript_90054:665-1288(+)
MHHVHQIVLDEAGRRLGIVHPSTQRHNEFLAFDRTTTIHIDHLKKLLKVHFVDVHDPQTTLKLCIRPGTRHDIVQSQQTLLVDVDTIKNLLEKSLVQHFDMFHLFRQVHHVRLSNFGKRVHYNCHNEVEHTENERQQRANKNKCRPRVRLNDRHGNESPTVSCYHSLEKEQIRIHHGLTRAYALFTAIEDTFLLLNLLNDWMNDFHH